MPAELSIESTDIRLLNLETRLPFEFGIVTMTEVPHCFVTVELEIDDVTKGMAADHFPPQWLMKDPDISLHQESRAILTVVERACELAESIEGDTGFECWRRLYEAQRKWAANTDYPLLLWNFGVTFVERAMIDAFCRATDRRFLEAIHENALGTRPGYIYPELEGTVPADHLPDKPKRSITVRHTIGHDDPLRGAGTPDPNDDLPTTLVENLSTYGLDRFKIKLSGEVNNDYERLRNILTVLGEVCDEYAFTLDANEQYRSLDDLKSLFDRLRSDKEIKSLEHRLLFVEQPFPRDIALSSTVAKGIARWENAPPIIIDESDGRLDSFGRALECGYTGTSVKSCKGVFKGIVNTCLADRRRQDGDSIIISGEDLTTIGPVSLQQDLALLATLGIEHIERNGHHYFRGLEMFDNEIQSTVLSAHDDLYRNQNGIAVLNITDGSIALDSVLNAHFGYACEVDPTQYDTPAEWELTGLN